MKKITVIVLMLFTVLSYAQLGVNGNIIEINKEMVGLGNIDNTSDNNKPVSVATLAALNLKTDIASPAFTGTVTIPTLIASGNTYPNTDGENGQVLATDGYGTLSWSTPATSSTPTYDLNTFYAELGGFVIEVRDGGKHGLVVAMQDQGLSKWYPIDNLLNDVTKHDTNGTKFMDWRLPTIRELELIYLAKANISPMWGGNDYWSSTQRDYANAYFVNMANGFGTSSNSPGANHNTNNSKAVRAVRAF